MQYQGIGETFSFQEVEVKGEKEFFISGYISTKAIDKFNDTITDDCLNDMLIQVKSGSIKIDFEHETIHNDNLDINPIARIVDSKLDNKGLWVKAVLNSSHKRFSEISGSIKKGFLDSFSIAFKPLETATRFIQGKAVRILNKLKLINVGITGTPVNDECKLDAVIVKAISEIPEENSEDWKNLDELDDTEIKAHKYIKRTGSQGKYRYFYNESELQKEKDNVDEAKQMKVKEVLNDADELTAEELDEKYHIGALEESLKYASEDQKSMIKVAIKRGQMRESSNTKPYNALNEVEEQSDSTDAKVLAEELSEKYSGKDLRKALEGVSNPEVGNILEDAIKLSDKNSDDEHNKWVSEQNEKEKARANKTEKKAIETNHTSQSTSNEEDNRQKMEEETKPVEQVEETKTEVVEEVKTEATEEVKEESTETEVSELKEELAEVKAQLVEVQKQLAKPEFKAIQEAMPTTKQKDNVTPLGLIG